MLANRASTWPRDHFLPQHDGTALIVAHDVERILADIDADHGDRCVEFLRHGVLLVLGAPGQLIAGGAGARPGHPILMSPVKQTAHGFPVSTWTHREVLALMDRAEEKAGPEDVGEQALMRGLDTAFPFFGLGLSWSSVGR